MNKHFLTFALAAAIVFGAGTAQGQMNLPPQTWQNLLPQAPNQYQPPNRYQPRVVDQPPVDLPAPSRPTNCYSYRQGAYVWTHCD